MLKPKAELSCGCIVKVNDKRSTIGFCKTHRGWHGIRRFI